MTIGASAGRERQMGPKRVNDVLIDASQFSVLTLDVEDSRVLDRQRWCIVLLLNRHRARNDFAIVLRRGEINDIRCRDVTVCRCLSIKAKSNYSGVKSIRRLRIFLPSAMLPA